MTLVLGLTSLVSIVSCGVYGVCGPPGPPGPPASPVFLLLPPGPSVSFVVVGGVRDVDGLVVAGAVVVVVGGAMVGALATVDGTVGTVVGALAGGCATGAFVVVGWGGLVVGGLVVVGCVVGGVVVGGVVVGGPVVVGGSVVGAATHSEVMVFESSVTAASRARARPLNVADEFMVMLWSAMIVPAKDDPVPRVAELPTCQNTLHELAPLMRRTELPEAEFRVEPAWNTHTEPRSFCPSSVTVPVRAIEEARLYTPPSSLCPPRSDGAEMRGRWRAASLYAASRSSCARAATLSPEWLAPPTARPPSSVIDVPG